MKAAEGIRDDERLTSCGAILLTRPRGRVTGVRGNLRPVDRARAEEFLRFCIVGGAGFAVGAGVLLASMHLLGVDPIGGRFLSFALAVWATFELNRRWAVQGRGRRRRLAAFERYLGVQGLGAACSFSLYALLVLTLPPPRNASLPCLVAASEPVLLINCAGGSSLVSESRGDPGSAGSGLPEA